MSIRILPITLAIPADDKPQVTVAPILVTADEAAALLSLCKRSIFKLLASGHIESVHSGRARRIPLAALENYVARLRAEAADGAAS